jgi:hypothetical protein
MAHYAQLDENNIVLQVIVIGNDEEPTEADGINFCKSLLGQDTNWVKTSYNNNIRKRFAGIGFTYDIIRDAFISPQPFPSWTLNEETCDWDSPVPHPNGPGRYHWDEDVLNWVIE